MATTRWERKWILPVLAGVLLVPGSILPVQAAEEEENKQSFMPTAGIESVLEESYETDVKDNIDLYLVPNEEGEYLNMAFSDTGGESFTYIRSAPDEESGWTGKLYEDSAAEVLEYLDGWTRIRSGDAEGYVPADTLITGKNAAECADEYEQETASVTAYTLNVRAGQGTDTSILTQIHKGEEYKVTGEPVNGWYPLSVGETDGWVSGKYITIENSYSYGETKEQEEARIAEEEKQKRAEMEAKEKQAAQKAAAEAGADVFTEGQAVIDYACQFIGNPYVWGGTSLTEGADCSGFVQSVYAHFGISLPRTSYEMRSAGYAVSYDDAQPGDLILYEGHVGLYMGDGQIVNAMNEKKGIGICNADYTRIIDKKCIILFCC